MPSVSPIAAYLRANNVIAKKDKLGCHFFSREGLYVGRLRKTYIDNYRLIVLDVFGAGFKKLYTKTVAYGHQYVYIKNNKAPLGVSIAPIKTYMRNIFVNFFEGTSRLEDTLRTLTNRLDLIAVDKNTQVGLYDTDLPLKYKDEKSNLVIKKLKHPMYTHIKH